MNQRKSKYQRDKEIFGTRKSYSKTDTDTDATFMCMKEDYMRNGHLKARYKCTNRDRRSIFTGL